LNLYFFHDLAPASPVAEGWLTAVGYTGDSFQLRGPFMTQLVRLLLLLPLVAAASGCLSSSTLVRLRPDGSGTIEQTLLANLQALKGLAQMFGKGELAGRDALSADRMFDEAELRKAGEKIGRGVRFVSRTPITEGPMEGVKAVYAFDDVNALAVNQNPSMPGVGVSDREDVTFKLSRLASGNSLVTVELPQGKDAVNTNASHVSGSRVTLLELDLGALVQQRGALEKLQTRLRPGMTVNEVKGLLEGIRGIKLNESPLTIEFRGR
jgi:hypothetical protein